MRLNSRIAELRKKRGCHIESRQTGGRRPASHRYQYRWLNPTPGLTLAVGTGGPPGLPNDEIPRDAKHRYRIYCVPRFGEQTLIGWGATPEEVGVKIVEMGRKSQLDGCVVGILDTHGVSNDVKPGEWLLNPHEGRW